MKQVLIAQQSTIPHYRVPFYNTLEQLRPPSWRFDVVFDSSEIKRKRFFKEDLELNSFRFPTLDTSTLSIKLANKLICYQTFWRNAGRYDLVIVENAVNNITYPLCHLHKVHKTKVAYWGHGKDRSIEKFSVPKFVSENLKLLLARTSDGFFAYTKEVKVFLEEQGLSGDKIFVVNNSIDILEQRDAFYKWWPQKERIKNELGIQKKKVLLFVGRFTGNKRIELLLEAFSNLRNMDDKFHLLLVGSNGETYLTDKPKNVTYLGPIVSIDQLAPIYVASDIYAFPGAVGLGALQALCYNLPVVTINSSTHGPEIEYLSSRNSIVLEASTTSRRYAEAIYTLFNNPVQLDSIKDFIWTSIKHLTIEQMALNFIQGVNTILAS